MLDGFVLDSINIEDIDKWFCENCLAEMLLVSQEGKVFWCSECGTISIGFPSSVWKTPTLHDKLIEGN